ncbi:MAG: hypothetical protein A3K18_12555 [Lentisphaerae bacterium RIFOXYA12_64_32]|nr:MAG: hypothetical protein A3K18_12555 [Lentisphaerae bacterium RIFOXYA12_64_32]
MSTMQGPNTMRYFEWRNVCPDSYQNFRLPECLQRRLPADKQAMILDFGCGYGSGTARTA